jgi:hypothetical protein
MHQIDAALYARLTGESALRGRVWNGVAPGDASEPFITFNLVSGVDVWVHGGRAADQLVYQIKAVGSPSRVAVDTLYQLADARANDAPLTLEDGAVVMIRRESSFGFREVDANGRVYWHSGGNYRVIFAN